VKFPEGADLAATTLRFDNIQGKSIGGFNKDFETLVFLKFKAAVNARAWIKEISDSEFGIARSSSVEVLKFNAQFKALRASGVLPESVIGVAWTNLALTHRGLSALGVKQVDLDTFPDAFKQGMAARKERIGDAGNSDPTKWSAPFNSPSDIHAVLIVAADQEADLKDRVLEITGTAAFKAGVSILADPVEGRTRIDEPGHEHFGFKDGVSQPGIRGVTPPDDPLGNPDQGQPGQDLLWPGEFVLGYPTQIGHAKAGIDGPNPDPGPLSNSGPSWTSDGSYLVFRRLAQDVAGFRQQVEALAQQHGVSHDLMGAKLVGRYKSGCPLELRIFEPPHVPASTDPGKRIPALGGNDTLNNNFEFGDDPKGAVCPLASHIRKAYPRDEQTLANAADSESETQTHRLLRRGIPFGASYGSAPTTNASDARGLLFMCYQKDIEKQFEFVQASWVNNSMFPSFPQGRKEPGQDPIISQSPNGSFQLDSSKPPIQVQHFVTTTGGEYFLAPSIQALRDLGDNKMS
jgi:Dyp-type peroxidase family